MRAYLILSLLAVAWFAGCAEPVPEPSPWDGRDRDAVDPTWESYPLQPGFAAEFDIPMKVGETMGWDWFIEEEAPVLFDVHRHDGQDVLYLVGPGSWPEHTGEVTADMATPYSMEWENQSEEVLTLWLRAPIRAKTP